MFLAFQLSDIVTVPFGYLLDCLYKLTSSYGVALILFAIILAVTLVNLWVSKKRVHY